MPAELLKSHEEALNQYCLRPEAEVHNGDYLNSGATLRRHILATAAEHIGKEANRWEEQLHLGLDLEAQTAYGLSPGGRERALEAARRTGNTYGHRQLAAAAGISLSELSAVLLGKRSPGSCTFAKLCVAASCLLRGESEEAGQCRNVLEEVGRLCKLQGLRRLARRAEIDSANLNRVVKGRTKPSQLMLVKLHILLAEEF